MADKEPSRIMETGNKADLKHRTVFRRIVLSVIILNITIIAITAFMYPPLLKMSNSWYYILKPVILLLMYIPMVMYITKISGPFAQTVISMGTTFGVISGMLEVTHISVENFGHLDSHTESVSTAIFMLGLFLLYGTAGFLLVKKRGTIVSGIQAGALAAGLCMLIVITFGLSQLFWSFKAIEQHDIGSPDFIRSRWTDFHAFVIADMFEASFSVLLVGLVAGIIFGFSGGLIARLFTTRKIIR